MTFNSLSLAFYSKFYPATPENIADLKKADDRETPRAKDRLQRAMKIGVKIAMGSDMWSDWPGKTRGEATLYELDGLQKEGIPAIEIVCSSTMNAAELTGWSDKVGELAAGKFADVIAVISEPLQDITTLEHAKFVMKGATIVKNEFAAAR